MLVTFAHLIHIASVLPSDASALESSISALVSEITRLDNRSEFWERSLPWFTALVVAGLLGDAIVIVWERREETSARRRWIEHGFHPAEMSPTWKFILELIATAAIFVGVGLELWAGAAVAAINGQLRSKNGELRDKSNQLLELVTQQAGDAEERAAKLELILADRHITFQQRQEMLPMLRPQAGTEVLVEYVTPSGTDAPEYAIEIGGVFHDAGWKVIPSLGRLITMNPPLHGFAVEGGINESRAAKKALGVLDKRVHTTPPTPSPETGKMRKTGVVIYVGSK